jgi:uncharacterized protein (DUF885 family)
MRILNRCPTPNSEGISEPLACQELERYTILAPGQATAYFAGAMALTELRAEVELLQGEGFTRRGFHDLLFAQGFVSPERARQQILNICQAVRQDSKT